jgi:polysaccharide pyruvyl transferase WcaK-like protein
VTLVPFCRTDFVQALEMHRELGERVRLLDFWAPPIAEDLDVFLSELARLQFMVGERLHSAVLAAAMTVPFVAIPYKPKCLDFVGSIDPEFGLSLDYDQLTADNLWRRTRDALVQGRQIGGRFADRIATLRRALRETAEEIEGLVLASNKATEAAAWVG